MPSKVIASGSKTVIADQIIALTGTLSTDATTKTLIVGTGTLFTTELCDHFGEDQERIKYPYLFNTRNGDIKQIVKILSNTKLLVGRKFQSDLSAETCQGAAFNKPIQINISGPVGEGVIGTLYFPNEDNGQVVAGSAPLNYVSETGVDPIGVDAGTDISVVYNYTAQ